LDLGAFSVLTKPVALDHALELVRRTTGRTNGCAVVIADDDPDLRRILGEALASSGCSVRAAADGREALEAMGLTPADLAVLDLLMPGMDGLTTIARMRGDPVLRDVPVVVCVGRELSGEEMAELQHSV